MKHKVFNMSDRLKFRVFDLTYNTMYYKYQIGNVDPNENENYTAHALYVTPDKVDYKCEPHWCHFDENSNIVIMQCTGMRDINKKLIYEGDLVKNIYDDIVYTVIWDNDTAGFRLKYSGIKLIEFDTIRSFVNSISAKRISVARLYKYFSDSIVGVE